MVLVLAGVLTYANSLSNPFIFDDFGSVVRNPQIRHVWSVGQTLAPPDETAVAGRPLANLSFAINYAIGGLDVVGYHVVSLALHVMCALLLFGIMRRTLERIGLASGGLLALSVALLWTVHPLNSEVVDYLSERTESMMAVCYLWTLYASIRAMGSSRQTWWLTSAVLSCAAGVACKESIATAPLVVVIFDRVFLFDTITRAFRARWRFYAALASTWLLLLALVLSHGDVSSGGFASAHSSTWMYLLNQTIIVTRYFRLTAWPHGLVNYYGWVRPLTIGDAWPYALFLGCLFAATIVLCIRQPRLGFLGAWVFVTLAPSSSFAPIAAEVGAERRMYLPLMGVIALLVIGAVALWRRAGASEPRRMGSSDQRTLMFVVLPIAVALAATTVVRNLDYASALTMARTVLAAWPGPNSEQLVGQELASAGQHDEAIQHLRAAVIGYPPARYFLGSELFMTGKLDEAIEQLQQFVRDEPNIVPTRLSRILMARAFARKQQLPRAVEQLQIVLQTEPADPTAHGLLAEAFASQQAFGDAIPHYRAFLAANPRNASAWTGLGVALVSTGKSAEAVDAFRRAVAAEPGNTHFHQNLARALAEQGDIVGAAAEAQQAATLDPGDPGAHEVLGRVLAAQGRFDAARHEFARALQIDPSYAPAMAGIRSVPIKR
jgi:tetratricopeptide (TPR) repeat protein